MPHILLLNGPNLNLLGQREPEVYGSDTLDAIVQKVSQQAVAQGATLESFQSNSEAELIERIHATLTSSVDMIIFNPGAFTHTSVALRDALLGVNIPFIECHLSNVYQRESFRHHSYFSDIAVGVIAGFGANTYSLALTAAIEHLNHSL